jgi:hypothetical protein
LTPVTTTLNVNVTATGTATISANDVTGSIAAPTVNLTSSQNIINDLLLTGVSSLTVQGAATEFTFATGSTGNPPSSVFKTSDLVLVGIQGAPGSWSASVLQTQSAIQSQTAQSAIAAAVAGEAANTFGTDSVAEQIEFGFAGDVSTAPPMAHRLAGTGIGTPECFVESREGEECESVGTNR